MKTLDNNEKSILATALRAQARVHREHNKTLLKCAHTGGNAMITAKAAKKLAGEHDRQARELEDLATDVDNHATIEFKDEFPG